FFHLFCFCLILSRDESPPNTPQRHCNAEWHCERENQILGSSEACHTPQAHQNGPPIPFQLNLPHGYIHPGLPAPQNEDPFQIVNCNGQEM
ncbi:hypothetical protein BT96DRAFT_837088, partial [Gymnopus androsaceus JB14]